MAACNIQNPAPGAQIVPALQGNFADYTDNELKVIRFAERAGDFIQLASTDFPNAVTAFWFREEFRLTDGFRSSFVISSNGGTADGFAFVVQDDREEDTVGNAGNSLGFEDVFPRYLAIGFDFCSDRPDCTEQTVRIDTRVKGEDSETVASFTGEDLFGRPDIAPISIKVQIDYLANEKAVEVFVSDLTTGIEADEPLLRGNVSLPDILQDQFSLVGVSASNANSFTSNVAALDLTVEEFTLEEYLSGFRMVPEAAIQQVVDFGQVVLFTFVLVDSCNEPLENPPLLDEDLVIAFIQDTVQAGNKIEFNTMTQQGASVDLTFVTAQEIIATYDFEVEVDGVVVQGSPIRNIVQASRPEEASVSPIGAVLLGGLSLLVFLLILFAARGFWKYKTKLDEHEEDIEYGKTKETLDRIDKTIEYHMNPLVAPLDRLKERLERNKRFIQEIKEGQKNAEDSDFTVEQLQEENEQLRQQIVNVKREKEFADAAFNMSVASDEDFVFVPPPRQAFDDEDFGEAPEEDN